MSRRQAVWFAFACAALVRLLYLIVARPQFQYEYWELAGNIIQHGTLGVDGVPTTRFEVMYPLLVAAMRVIVRDRVFAAQLLQIVIGSLGAVWLYDLAETLTASRRVALVASLLFALNPLLVRHSADGTDVTLMATLLVGFCRAFVRARTPAGAAMAGVWLGVATLTRAMALPIVIVASAVLLIERRRGAAAAFAAAALAVFTPYAARNDRLNGAFMPSRTGLNLFVSNSAYTNAIVPEYQADWLEPYAADTLVAHGIAVDEPASPTLEREQDRVLTQIAWQTIKSRPLENIIRRIHYAGYLFSPFIVPRQFATDGATVRVGDGGQVVIEGAALRPLRDRLIYTSSFVPILVLAVVGVWLRHGDVRRDAALWSVAITFIAVHMIFFPATRYRAPMEFVLLFYAAVAIDRLVALVRRRADMSVPLPASIA